MSGDDTTASGAKVSNIDDHLGKVSRDTVSLEVSRKLLAYVLSGELKIGDRLPSERLLAEQLDVGRNAIRDGLRPLTLLGILEVRPGSGSYLKSATSELLPAVIEWGLLLGEPNLKHLMEARLYVESALAKLAAERRTDAELDAIASAADRMKVALQAGSVDEFSEADLEFHLRIAEAAGNDVLLRLLRSIRSLMEVWMRRVQVRWAREEPMTVWPQTGHAEILAAIERLDGRAARSAMESHLRRSMAQLLEVLDEERHAAHDTEDDPGAALRSAVTR